MRIASVSAILGAVIYVAALFLHPYLSDPSDIKATLEVIAPSAVWVSAHLGFFIGSFLIAGGLFGVNRSVPSGHGAAWAQLGFVSVLISSALAAVLISIDGIATKELAQAWVNSSGGENLAAFHSARAVVEINHAIFSLWMFLFWGISFVLFGAAVILSEEHPVWLGWMFAVGGIGSASLGMIQAYNGPSVVVTNVLFPGFSVLTCIAMVVIGVRMWRGNCIVLGQ